MASVVRLILIFAAQGLWIAPLLCGQLREAVKIVGELHKLVLFSDGSVGGWGDMRDGQLGPKAAVPNRRGQAKQFVPIAVPGKVIDIAAAERTSYVLLEGGSVLAFGYGADGELGCGDKVLQGSENPLTIATLHNVKRIEAAGKTAFAIHNDGTISAWGSRDAGIIGDGKNPERWGESAGIAASPVRVPEVANVSQLSTSGHHVLALTNDGKVLSWGSGGAQLGRTLTTARHIGMPEEIPGLANVATVAATSVASVALKKDGTVWVWGSNQQAEFGNGQRQDDQRSVVPLRVAGVQNVKAITRGIIGRHILVLLKDGTVRGWGNTDWGQVGNGVSGMEQATPASAKITAVKAIFAGGNNSFAVKTDGSLWMWGYGDRGEWPLAANNKLPVILELSPTR